MSLRGVPSGLLVSEGDFADVADNAFYGFGEFFDAEVVADADVD